ncbi:MAG: hypothetical protein NC084_06395 [Bacteroides sp.]|nr:hypothetical protein [Eubacterium sp.]MCM1418146.1 hypothetical protein [Roseburia sp.]MCM1462329.1 hypothetical protein [Bacteroides sp.]
MNKTIENEMKGTKFENPWYQKGYADGYEDSVNHPDPEDVAQMLENLSREDRLKVLAIIEKEEGDR